MERKFFALVDALWHPTEEARKALRAKGLFVYDLRSWDEGNGNTLENFVYVNYEGSIVTNFEITDWDYGKDGKQQINDYWAWVDKHEEYDQRDEDAEIETQVKTILKEAGLRR